MTWKEYKAAVEAQGIGDGDLIRWAPLAHAARACEHCQYFFERRLPHSDGVPAQKAVWGECRRQPPVPKAGGVLDTVRWLWPKVDGDNWCGEFRAPEGLAIVPGLPTARAREENER